MTWAEDIQDKMRCLGEVNFALNEKVRHLLDTFQTLHSQCCKHRKLVLDLRNNSHMQNPVQP